MAITNPLNIEAGQVPVPDDPEEIVAVLRASRVMWRAFPYLGWRYGERGERFGKSDTGYCLTLLGYDQRVIDKQIDWMVGLLSPRGMPSWVLEAQLRALVRVLRRSFKGSPRFEPLLCAADRLREQRRSRLTDTEVNDLATQFAERAGFPERRWARGAGMLLASAVADELNGQKLGVEGVAGWFTDRAVFSRAWIDAVRSTVRAARRIGAARAK